MASVGGSCKECSIDGRIFPVPGDAEVTVKTGGYANEPLPNGDGTSAIQKNAESGGVEGLQVRLDHDRNDLKFLQDVADGKRFVNFTITFADDSTFGGEIMIADMPGASSKSATAEIKVFSNGKIQRQ
jgi:hypothetical protein